MNPSSQKEKLDNLVVTIELTLLSVIQGVALFFLADNARVTLLSLDYEHFVYLVIAFLFLIIFWSQTIVHVISFISWPIEFAHTFLYFLVVILEILMFSSVANPSSWFAVNVFFFISIWVLYYADLRLLKTKKQDFMDTEAKKIFYEATLKDQRAGLFVFTPVGAFFSFVSWFLIAMYPSVFLEGHWHILLGAIEMGIGIFILARFMSVFKKRFAVIEGF
ncbi:MAG: hypothetical protein PHV93_02590 [Candidatus Pacebacteria bacterium]|nr:hypothetical protein [Candidatus Paceibacterota bacterium]